MANKKPSGSVLKQDNAPFPATVQPKGEGGKSRYSAVFIMAFLLGLIAFIAYANTLKNGFVLDDHGIILKNTIVTKGMSAIPEILATPYRRGLDNVSNDLYRPLSLVMFAVEYQLFAADPMPYHLINILVFMGCVILLFLFLDKVFERKRTIVAFIASLLFALHPIHTEVVANIKSRDELLCFFFMLLSLNVFIKYLQTGKTAKLLLAAGCFFLSLLAKETAITFIAIVPLIFFRYRNENKKRSIHITVSAIIVSAIFLVIRYSVLTMYHVNDTANVSFLDNMLARPGLAYTSRVATAILILGNYIKLLVVPYPLVSDYSFSAVPFAHFSDPLVLVSLALYLFLVFFSVRRLFSNRKDPYAFAILFFLITIALFSNIVFLIGSVMAERFLFFPSVGYCLTVALLLSHWAGDAPAAWPAALKQPKIAGVLIPVLLVYAFITIGRNSDWTDDYTLFSNDVKKSPNSSRLNYYMGSELQNTKLPEENDPEKKTLIMKDAIDYFNRSIAIYPEFPDAHANLGYVYFHVGMKDSAEIHDKLALQYQPVFPNVVNNLAEVYFVQKKYDKAIDLYVDAIKKSPEAIELYANLSTCLGSIGRYDSAIFYARAGLQVDTGYKKLYENIALCYKLMNRLDSAAKYAAMAREH